MGVLEYCVDSFLSLTYVRTLQRRYGNAVSLSAMIKYPTLRELGLHITQEGGVPAHPAKPSLEQLPQPNFRRNGTGAISSELLPINPRGQYKPSFWLHGAPGLAQLYGTLSVALGAEYPLYAIQARGVDGKQAPITQLDEMIDHYIKIIQEVQPEGPYFLGGYSYGGILAFEAAQELSRRGEEIEHLVMFDTYSPAMVNAVSKPSKKDKDTIRNIQRLMNAMMFFTAELDTPIWDFITLDELKKIPSGSQFAHVARLIKANVLTALSLDEIYSFLTGVDSIALISESCLRNYNLSNYCASDVLYFKTARFVDDDSPFVIPGVSLEEVGMSANTLDQMVSLDYLDDWRKVIQTKLEVVEMPCDHLSLFSEPAITEVSLHLKKRLTSIVQLHAYYSDSHKRPYH